MLFRERFQRETKDIIKDEDDIPIIPDIDDVQDDPLNLHDVKPMYVIIRVWSNIILVNFVIVIVQQLINLLTKSWIINWEIYRVIK